MASKDQIVANRLHRSLDNLDQTIISVIDHKKTFNHPSRLRLLDKFRLVA